MAHLSNYAESGLLNWLFRANSNNFGRPATVAIALCGNVPHEGQNGLNIPEIPQGVGYSRANLGAPSNSIFSEVAQSTDGSGYIQNSSQITFGPATADWGWVSGVAVLNSGVHGSGDMLMWAKVPSPRFVQTDDTIVYDAARFEIYFG